jgi:hypothetical protein
MVVASEEDGRLLSQVEKMREDTVEEMIRIAEQYGRSDFKTELNAAIQSFFNKMFDTYEFIEKIR